MKKKLIPQAFAVAFSAAAITKFSAAGDGASAAVELVALAVLPASPFRTTDSRSGIQYSYDANALIAAHTAKGRKLPLDIEHATESGGARDTRARGWVHQLSNAEMEPLAGFEQGVLYAWVELTPLGKQELADRLFGYTSGVSTGAWVDETHLQLFRVQSLALTNSPATEMPCNFTADNGDGTDTGADTGSAAGAADAPAGAGYTQQLTTEQQEMLSKILEKLGVTADAAEADVLLAVDALIAPAPSAADVALAAVGFTVSDVPALVAPAAFAAVNVQLTAAQGEVVALTAQVGTLTASLTAATAAESTRLVFAAVDGAISARKATPAQRASLAKFAAADPVGFADYVAEAPVVLAEGNATTPAVNVAETFGLTAEDQAAATAQGISFSSYANGLAAARAQLGL